MLEAVYLQPQTGFSFEMPQIVKSALRILAPAVLACAIAACGDGAPMSSPFTPAAPQPTGVPTDVTQWHDAGPDCKQYFSLTGDPTISCADNTLTAKFLCNKEACPNLAPGTPLATP